MNDGCPRIGNVEEQCVSFDFFSFYMKALSTNISPVRSDLFDVQILKELFSDFLSLLIKLKSEKFSFFSYGLSDST